MTSENQHVREPWVFLLGVPPIEEFLGFLSQAAGSESVDLAAAGQRWMVAADATRQLAVTEVGAADGHAVQPLADVHEERQRAFLGSASVAATYVTSTPNLAVVSLDGLVVFQRQVNLRYAAELQSFIGDRSLESAHFFDFCLNIDQPEPAITGMVSGNTAVFSSASTDARFLGAKLVEAGQVAGHTPIGRPTSAVVLYVGYGTNAINVLDINGRLVLNNGSHRAYALKAIGATHAIAVVQHLTRREELGLVPAVQQNPGPYLESSRPPMLKDYFNPALTEIIESQRRVRQIRLQFGVEQLDAPG